MSAANPGAIETVAQPLPKRRPRASRVLAWIVIGVVAVIGTLVILAQQAGSVAPTPFSATDPSPSGAEGVAQVLGQQGVHVITTASLTRTRAALAAHPDAAVLLIPGDIELAPKQLRRLATSTRSLILLEPDFTELDTLAPRIDSRGSVHGYARLGCQLGEVAASDSVLTTGRAYAIDGDANASGCLDSGSKRPAYGLITTLYADTSTTLTIVGAAAAIENRHAANGANGAFALTVLGARPTLIWYTPGIDDVPRSARAPGILPSWYTLFVGVAALVAIAAAVWRGRRFGPLVLENLPVIVRASETMEGRARLYARSSARTRAIDAIRIGTLSRIAVACGLPRRASVDEIIEAVHAATLRPIPELRALLRDEEPTTDADLIGLSDRLTLLERETVSANRGR